METGRRLALLFKMLMSFWVAQVDWGGLGWLRWLAGERSAGVAFSLSLGRMWSWQLPVS